MDKLRKFLGACFGYFAAIFFLVSLSTVPSIFRFHHEPIQLGPNLSPLLAALAPFLVVLSDLILAIPPVLAAIFGMSWWTLRFGKPSARRWALVASVAVLLQTAPFLALIAYGWFHPAVATPVFVYVPTACFLAAGGAGLVAFWRPGCMAPLASLSQKPAPIAGDGTNKFLDAFAGVLAGAGVIAGMYAYERWARLHHLHRPNGYIFWLDVFAIALVTTTVHELGHASVGLAFGMKLRALVFGPFHWRVREGRWKFEFHAAGFISAEGVTGVVPSNPRHSLWSVLAMIAAGPMANLVTGLLALWALITSPGRSYQAAWEPIGFFATASLVTFAVNLLPLHSKQFYSDGARIYQILKGGPWADIHRVFAVVGSTLVTQLRPRDYDIVAIRRSAAYFTCGHEAFVLRLFATSYFEDSGAILHARQAIVEAEHIYEECALDISADLHAAVVFDIAFLLQDATRTRTWWDRMEAKKPTYFGVDYWLARSALLWMEGNLVEADEGWEKASVLAAKLPHAGAYEFDRYRCQLLRKALDGHQPLGESSQSLLIDSPASPPA